MVGRLDYIVAHERAAVLSYQPSGVWMNSD
jgi:hypothetical protein